ncbi:CoA transferase [Pseudofrankia inefficax]|uniref:L-carnitine dehydratase/bile acid-inducible protein F n=1 Tax=Pseudofrankia inefficax (strain DSM 45817 / CECT 9037 / DDB 130130 / EuI1c) TaxID=298654 RepID=E3J1E5_PSEI1|nr:CoA transferase [Pseudofrankia inefficax]ADP80466.1 L-carnitine dehydratase/bile acid-inducible protein F [Pseudofrankia inefficax]
MSGWLSAVLPVLPLATMSVEAVRAAAVRAGATGPIVRAAPDPERVAAAFGSERLFRDGDGGADAFAPLSGFFPTRDGWVRTHANYPHHRDRLLRLLGLPDAADRETVAKAIEARPAAELEDLASAAGALAVRVRTEAEWRASEPGAAAAVGPLVRRVDRDDVDRADAAARTLTGGALPLAGVRVLDLTRVLAGPVCGRTLALLGADVLRLDPPVPAEIAWQQLDTGQGKRTAILDLRTDLARAQELLDAADVLVTGYRPGAIEAFGLRPPPGLIRARVNAWGDTGPWAGRRGFDSIVQAASGIALLESADGATPGALPAQALDHATGYLLAASIIDALVDRAADGRGRDLAAALARTAAWLLDRPGREPDHPAASVPTARSAVTHGTRTTARPALPGFDDYPFPAHPWGSDQAAFGEPRP